MAAGSINNCFVEYTDYSASVVPAETEFKIKDETNFTFKTKNGADFPQTVLIDVDLEIDGNTDKLSFTIAVLSPTDSGKYTSDMVYCAVPPDLSCGTPELLWQGWLAIQGTHILDQGSYEDSGAYVQAFNDFLQYKLDPASDTYYRSYISPQIGWENQPCGAHSITMKDENYDSDPFELQKTGLWKLKGNGGGKNSWPNLTGNNYQDFTFTVVITWEKTQTVLEKDVSIRVRGPCDPEDVPYVNPNNNDRTIGNGNVLVWSFFTIYDFPVGCSNFYSQVHVYDTTLLNSRFDSGIRHVVYPASGSQNTGTLSSGPLSYTIQLKYIASQAVVNSDEFLVTFDYTCSSPPGNEDRAIAHFTANGDTKYWYWLPSTVLSSQCILSYSIQQVEEMNDLGSWIPITAHPFYLNHYSADNYIRLRANATISNELYRVTVRGTYRIGASSTASSDYRMPIYGDYCYTALDNMDYSTRFELFDAATFQFGQQYSVAPTNLYARIRGCSHVVSKTDASLSGKVYQMNWVDATTTIDLTFIFAAVDIGDSTHPAGTYEFDLTLAYKGHSYTFKYQMSLPDRCSSPWASIISSCPLDYYNVVAYYNMYKEYITQVTKDCIVTSIPSNCATGWSKTISNRDDSGHIAFSPENTIGAPYYISNADNLISVNSDSSIQTTFLTVQYTYGTNLVIYYNFYFTVEFCPCQSFSVASIPSQTMTYPYHESVPIQTPTCTDSNNQCQTLPDSWQMTYSMTYIPADSTLLDTSYFDQFVGQTASTPLTLRQDPETPSNITANVLVTWNYFRKGAIDASMAQTTSFSVEFLMQPRCYDYQFTDASLADFTYDVGNTVTLAFSPPVCQQENPDLLHKETDWNYTFARKDGGGLPTGISMAPAENTIFFAITEQTESHEQIEFELTATGADETDKTTKKTLIVNVKCRCLSFTIDLTPSVTQAYLSPEETLTIPEPNCSLSEECLRPTAWVFSLANGSTGDPYPTNAITLSTTTQILVKQVVQLSSKEQKFQVKVNAMTDDNYIWNDLDLGNDGELTTSQEFQTILHHCECSSYEMVDIENFFRTPDILEELIFEIPPPQCTQQLALEADNCMIADNWVYIALNASLDVTEEEKEVLPSEFGIVTKDIVIHPYEGKALIVEPVAHPISLVSTAFNFEDFLVTPETEESFELIWIPCYCKLYAVGPIESVIHVFRDDPIEIEFDIPVCQLVSKQCIDVEKWTYAATLQDESSLPEEVTLNSGQLKFTIDQKVRNPELRVLNVTLSATTEDVELDGDVKFEFQVTLDPGPAETTFVNEDALSILDGLGILISVKPDMSSAFTMLFDGSFSQKFMFKIEPDDNPMSITVGGQEYPYIKKQLSESTLDISIDGAAALAFTKATDTVTASFDIKVNQETFTFTIKISHPFEGVSQETEDSEVGQIIYGLPELGESDDEDGYVQEIKAELTRIEKNGAISISYVPPAAFVPENWEKIFVEKERQKVSNEEQKDLEETALFLMHVVFLQNSEEAEQKYFLSNLTDFSSEGLTIRLNFSDPLLVSQGEFKDQIRIKLHKSYFLTPIPNEWQDLRQLAIYKEEGDYLVWTEDLPLQFASQEAFEKFDGQAKGAKTAIQSQFLASFILQIFMSGALSMLWNIFNTMQIILLLNLMMISFPANVSLMQEQFEDLVNFELLPKDFVYDNLLQPTFNLETSEEKELKAKEQAKQREANGEEVKSPGIMDKFAGKSTLSKLVDILLAFILLLSVIGTVLCCKFTIMPKCPSCIKNILLKIERKLFWNSVLRACLETYLGTCVFVCIAMNELQTNNFEGRIEFITWLITLAYVVYFPFGTFRVLRSQQATLNTTNTRERFGSLYQSVEIYKGPIAYSFTLYFCVRRLLFAYTVANEHNTIVYQVFILDFLSTFMLGFYTTVRPMEDGVNNFIQIFNEWAVLTCIQMMFLFTYYVNDAVVRYDMGFYFLYFVALNIAINLAVLLVMITRKIIAKIKSFFKQRQFKNAMKVRMQNALIKNETGEGGNLFFQALQSKLNAIQNAPLKTESDGSSASQSESSSSSSSEGYTSFSDEDAPTREQICFFSEPEFRQDYNQFLLVHQNNIGAHGYFAENPYILEEYMACHKFELEGYRFSRRHRTAKRIARILGEPRKFSPERKHPEPLAPTEPAPAPMLTHMIDTTDAGRKNVVAAYEEHVPTPAEIAYMAKVNKRNNFRIVEQQTPGDISIRDIEQQVDEIINGGNDKETKIALSATIDNKMRRKNRHLNNIMGNAQIVTGTKTSSSQQSNQVARHQSKLIEEIANGEIIEAEHMSIEQIESFVKNSNPEPTREEARQLRKTRHLRNMEQNEREAEEAKENDQEDLELVEQELKYQESQLRQQEERKEAILGGTRRRNRHLQNVMSEVVDSDAP